MKTCSVIDCGGRAYCRGYCAKHYLRVRRHGTPDGGRLTHDEPADRFARLYEVDEATGCWNFRTLSTVGYGLFRVGDKQVGAHRWSYEHHVGPIPADYDIDHLCRNRGCVNPSHLEPVTRAENNRRKREAAAHG